jgi:hypothetical protein
MVDGEKNKYWGVSVIVATRGRVPLVGSLLKGLQVARDQFDGKHEVVVVDDSSESEAEQLSALCEQYGAKFVQCGPNVTIKRNYGARLAQFDILLFLDSDCVATPQLLREHEKYYHNPDIGSVLGLLEFVGPDSWFWSAIQLTPFVMPFDFPKLMQDAPWGPSANLSVRRDVFQAVGGFDETFPQRPGGEDVDLGLRIAKAGYRIRCNPEAIARHSKGTWIPLGSMCHRLLDWGVAECYLMERHPDRVVMTLPRKTLIFIATALVMLVVVLLTGQWWFTAIFPLWVVLDILLQATLQLLWAGRSLGQLPQQFVAALLVLVNELGMVRELIRRRQWRYWVSQMLYTPGQMEGE